MRTALVIFILLKLSIFIQACKQVNQPLINCAIVEDILEKDQRYRQTPELRSVYFYILDSLVKESGSPEGIDALNSLSSDLQEKLRTEARQLEKNVPKPDQQVVDSLWRLQKELDYKNTMRVLEIIDEVGLAVLDTMDFDCSKRSLLVFVHTPDELKEKVRNTIESGKEFIKSGQYNHIMWHLNGRGQR